MNFLNELYQSFDDLVDDFGMYKLDIVGDCYIVVAGLIKEDQASGSALFILQWACQDGCA